MRIAILVSFSMGIGLQGNTMAAQPLLLLQLPKVQPIIGSQHEAPRTPATASKAGQLLKFCEIEAVRYIPGPPINTVDQVLSEILSTHRSLSMLT
jgi:hypothetical protein